VYSCLTNAELGMAFSYTSHSGREMDYYYSTRGLQLYWELLWILKKLEQSQITTPGSVGDILFPSGMIVFLFTSFGILRQQNRHVCDTIKHDLFHQASFSHVRLLTCAHE
jgi:hypothetical protein